MRLAAVLGLALALSACGPADRKDAAATATFADAPPVAFFQCRSCHSVEAGRTIIGPSLHGIVGRPSASVAGYTYSNALKASHLTWDARTLDAWLTQPAKLVPGNKMMFMGQPDPALRKQVIDYLAKQK